jgi:hypothetical protein
LSKFKQVNIFVEFQLAVPGSTDINDLNFIAKCLDEKIRTLVIEYASGNNYSTTFPVVRAGMNSQDDPE